LIELFTHEVEFQDTHTHKLEHMHTNTNTHTPTYTPTHTHTRYQYSILLVYHSIVSQRRCPALFYGLPVDRVTL